MILSAGMVFYLFKYKVDFREVIRVFADVHWGWLLAGASLHVTGLLFSSIRWKILLSAQNIHQSIFRLISYYLVGHFFNMFLPTKVGGDVVRIYDTSRDHGSTAQPLAVILVERISGMLTMLVLAVLVLILNIQIGFDYRSRIPGLNLGITIFLLGVFFFPFLFHPRIERLVFDHVFSFPIIRNLKGMSARIYKAFQIYGQRIPALLNALAIGTLLQINYFFHYYFLARALDIQMPLSFFFVMIPIRTVTLMIPFFINGIGLREFFDVTAFGLVGVSRSAAVAFAELAWFVQIAFALFGGMVYLTRGKWNQDHHGKHTGT